MVIVYKYVAVRQIVAAGLIVMLWTAVPCWTPGAAHKGVTVLHGYPLQT